MLNGGSRAWWIFKKAFVTVLVCSLSIVATEYVIYMMGTMSIHLIVLRYGVFGIVYVITFLQVGVCCDIACREFVIEDGFFFGFDIYTITYVEYSKHCLYINGHCINFVPSGRKLYKSLDDYYFQLTGGYLP